jgi:hypothetical protein
VTSWEVLSTPMGERRRRLASGESGWTMPSLGLGRDGDTVGGCPVSKTLRAEASGESEVLRDPSA